MNPILRNLLYSGIQERLTPEQGVKLLFVNTTIFVGSLVLAFFAARDFVSGHLELAIPTAAIVLVVIGLFFAIRIFKSPSLGAWFLPVLMFGFYLYLSIAGGPNTTAALWSLTYPLVALFMLGPKWGSAFSLVFMATEAVLFFVPGISPLAETGFEYKIRMAGTFTIIFSFSLAFETIRRQTQERLARTGDELSAAKVQTDGILNTVSEGIFLLDKDLTMGDQNSQSLAGLLDVTEPAGHRLIDALRGRISERDREAARDYLEMFFLPDPPWHLMEEINPLAEVTLASPDATLKHLTFSFGVVELATGRRVLGTVRDVTQSFELSRRLKAEEDKSARQMKHLFQIIHVKPELLLQFLQDADQEITSINRRLKDPQSEASRLVEDLFQGVHAVKGNAALVGLSAFAHKVHELETKVAELRGKKVVWQDFLEMTVGLSIIQAELSEIRELLGRMSTFQRGLEASSGSQDLLLLAVEKAISTLSREAGYAVELDASTFQPELVPEKHRKLVKDVLGQLIRNSFAHAFEPGAERLAAGKPARPRVRLTTKLTGSTLSLAYWDDGRGFNPDKLRAAAKALKGWKGGDPAALTDDQALQLAFAPGLSTTGTADLGSGRGVGLSLVKERIEAAGGRVKLRSVPGKGVAFDLTFPG